MESNRKKDPELADFLRSSIQKSGLSYENAADQLNIRGQAARYYCSGERKPGQKTLLRFVRTMNIQAKDIPF